MNMAKWPVASGSRSLRTANRWRRQAKAELAFLPVVKKVGKYDTCCFLAQQTALKALKACLYAQGEELIFTRSVFRLCEIASRYQPACAELSNQIKNLDYYYVEARYPNAIEDVIPAEFYNRKDATQAIAAASAALALVEKFLPAME